MKLKSRLYQLKNTPVWFKIIFGTLLIVALIIKTILKWLYYLIYFLYKKIAAFNERKVAPLIEKINNYLYKRACQTFECENELETKNYLQSELDIRIPFLIKLRGYFVEIIYSIFKKKRKKSFKSNSFVSDKKVFHESKTSVSKLKNTLLGYLAWLHTLFRPEFK